MPWWAAARSSSDSSATIASRTMAWRKASPVLPKCSSPARTDAARCSLICSVGRCRAPASRAGDSRSPSTAAVPTVCRASSDRPAGAPPAASGVRPGPASHRSMAAGRRGWWRRLAGHRPDVERIPPGSRDDVGQVVGANRRSPRPRGGQEPLRHLVDRQTGQRDEHGAGVAGSGRPRAVANGVSTVSRAVTMISSRVETSSRARCFRMATVMVSAQCSVLEEDHQPARAPRR